MDMTMVEMMVDCSVAMKVVSWDTLMADLMAVWMVDNLVEQTDMKSVVMLDDSLVVSKVEHLVESTAA